MEARECLKTPKEMPLYLFSLKVHNMPSVGNMYIEVSIWKLGA
jgi:hypothetical protein